MKYAPHHKTQRLCSAGARVLILLLTLCCVHCGGGGGSGNRELPEARCDLNTRVINGSSCSNVVSSVVRLDFIDPVRGPSGCSGVVIGQRSVLTAAHCFLISNATDARITIGNFTTRSTHIYVHPHARIDRSLGAVFDDVAIVETGATLPITPVPVLLSRTPTDGDPIFIYGYGLDEQGNQGVLKAGSMRLNNVTPDHLFASYSGTGANTCRGDSGGPAILVAEDGTELGLVAVISSGKDSACGPGDTTLFTRLDSDSVLTFLQSKVADLRAN